MLTQLKWWLLILMAALLIAYLMPNSLSMSIEEHMDRSEVETIATNFLHTSEYSLQDYHPIITRNSANFVLVFLKSCLDQERFKILVNSDSIPNIRWQVQYAKDIPRDQPQSRYSV